MIRDFGEADVKTLFEGGHGNRRWRGFERIARRKLLMLHAAVRLDDLRAPPANRLEKLSGDRAGQHSIRINDQYRVCFVWRDGDAYAVEIVDYH